MDKITEWVSDAQSLEELAKIIQRALDQHQADSRAIVERLVTVAEQCRPFVDHYAKCKYHDSDEAEQALAALRYAIEKVNPRPARIEVKDARKQIHSH